MKKTIHRILSIGLVVCLLLSVCACGDREEPVATQSDLSEPQETAFPVTIGEITLKEKPQRVVSLSPMVTEIAYDLGFSGQLYARSEYCDYPASATSLETAGTPYQPDIEGIISGEADLVITQSALSPVDLQALEAAGIPVLTLSSPRRLEELGDFYQTIGTAFGGKLGAGEAAREKAEQIISSLSSLRSTSTSHSILYLTSMAPSAATLDTFEGTVLAALGFENAAGENGDYAITLEEIAAADPDLLVVPQPVTLEDLKTREGYQDLSCVGNGNVLSIDQTAVERRGQRMVDVFAQIANAL